MPLCQGCVRRHREQFESKHHALFPPHALHCRDDRLYAQAQSRLTSISRTRTLLSVTIEDIHALIASVERRCLEISTDVAVFREQTINALQELMADMRRKVESACRTVEKELLTVDPHWETEWTKLAACCPEDCEGFLLWKDAGKAVDIAAVVGITYAVTVRSELQWKPAELRSIGSKEFRSDVQSENPIAIISPTKLCFYWPIPGTWTQYALRTETLDAAECSLIVYRTDCHWRVAAGWNYYRPVSQVRQLTSSGQLEVVSALQGEKYHLAAILLQDFLFVLGGAASKTGELLSLIEKIPLGNGSPPIISYGNMRNPRRSFAPCANNDKVLICGGFSTAEIEMMDCGSLICTAVPVALPEVSETFAVTANELCIVFTKTYVVKWQLGQTQTMETEEHCEWCAIADASTVQYANEAIYSAAFGQINVFSLSPCDLSRISPPASLQT